MLGAPLGERVDDEALRRRAPLPQNVDDVDSGARRERAHERVDRILPGLRGPIEPCCRPAGAPGVEAVLAGPRRANRDRRLRGMGDDLGMRHETMRVCDLVNVLHAGCSHPKSAPCEPSAVVERWVPAGVPLIGVPLIGPMLRAYPLLRAYPMLRPY